MDTPVIHFAGTRGHAARRVRLQCFGLPGLAGAALVLGLAGFASWASGSPLPAAGALAALLFLGHVLHLFILQELENDTHAIDDAHLGSLLSAAVVWKLRGRDTATMGDLMRAAADTPRGRFILQEIGLRPADLLASCLEETDRSIDVRLFMRDARARLASFGETRVDANVILALLFEYVPCCKLALLKCDMSEADLEELLQWEAFHHRAGRRAAFLDGQWLRSVSIGRSWVSGYTHTLDLLAEQMDQEPAVRGEKSLVIHEKPLQSLLDILLRPGQRNALILGNVGTGKRTLVANAVRRLRTLEYERNLPFTRALRLRTEQLLSAGARPDSSLFAALQIARRSGPILLVIRDLGLLLKSAKPELLAVLTSCLQSQTIGVVGVIDAQDYHAVVKTNPQVDSLFEKVAVEDASDAEAMQVLIAHATAHPRWPRLPYKSARAAVALGRRFLFAKGGFPAVPLGIVDAAAALARENGDQTIAEEYIRTAVSRKSGMDVQRLTGGERERLLHLEDILRERVIGQEEAVRGVANALKRARMDVHERKKPLGTFLFLGPTGVGKTHTAKALAAEYFGSPDAMIRLDMNEFGHEDSVFGIIGSVTGGAAEGYLTQRVQEKPFSVILLDEIEKAHPKVLNLFLQVLDEGMLTDERGVQTSFRNALIIATSNAGALAIRDFVAARPDADTKELRAALIEKILSERIFSPEFLNRFDETVVFRPLSPAIAEKIAALELRDIVDQIRRKRGITVSLAPAALAAIVEHGFSAAFGARELSRTLLEKVEDYLAEYLLRHDVKAGDSIAITEKDLRW